MNEHHMMRVFMSVALLAGISGFAAANAGPAHRSGGVNPQTLQKHDASNPVRGKKKPVNPGIIKGFNPQPEPPGHSFHGSPQGPGTTKAIVDDNTAPAIVDDNTAPAIIDDNGAPQPESPG